MSQKTNTWKELQRLSENTSIEVEKVRLPEKGISIEGQFSLPPLALLSDEDQIFVCAFVTCHGSIKEMEKTFGVSYPTIKNRLNKITQNLGVMDVTPKPSRSEILDQLERGEISAADAARELKR